VVLVIQGVANLLTEDSIASEIFRAYDIRGIVDETLTVSAVTAIGRALGTVVLERSESTIVVGRDGRLSGETFRRALCEGVLSTGCNVVDIGMVPTPVLYFATQYLKIPSGVMITGSHNPPDYNGLKMMVGGKSLYGEGILSLEKQVKTGSFKRGEGRYQSTDMIKPYLDAIVQDVKPLKKLKVVLDCGNGVAGVVAPLLYEALGCTVIPLFCEVDGTFPNHHPDPGQPENLKSLITAVKTHQADIGIAFDGDGDRLGVVDNKGNIIWPDRLLILLAKDLLEAHPKALIIFDVKCTRQVALSVQAMGGEPLMWKTGHSLIKAKIAETGALLAGEMSGHLFFNDRWFGFDDGLYAGIRLLDIVSRFSATQTTQQLFSAIPDSVNTPELILPVAEAEKFGIIERLLTVANFAAATISTIDGLRVDFKDGFGLVRPSNTGPNLILRFEGDTLQALNRIQAEFRVLLHTIKPQWPLPF
jgi:phosphomannomutase/phosphoglucomutase